MSQSSGHFSAQGPTSSSGDATSLHHKNTMPPAGKHTAKKSRGKLQPRMLKIPKYEKIHGKRRELSNVEKGMIIAFFVVYGTISTVSLILGRPWSTTKSFLQRYHKRGNTNNLPRSGRPEVLTQRDKRAILRGVRKNWQYTREQIPGSTPPIFP